MSDAADVKKLASFSDYFDKFINYPEYSEGEPIVLADRSLPEPPEAIVNLDVPFIHQLWDTPLDFNGNWACGAVCATMVLAYYGLLEPRPIEIPVPKKHSSDYGWYLSNAFSHEGHTFSATARAPGGKYFAGIYGTVLDYHKWGIGWATAGDDLNNRDKGLRVLMNKFLPQVGNGLTIEFGLRGTKRSHVEALLTETLDAGHPVILSTFLFKLHHLVVVRGYYRDAAGVLQWIVNDPYGYQTDKSFDGCNVVYTYEELKPKWMTRFHGPFTPQRAGRPVQLFDENGEQHIGNGILGKGDKVYVQELFSERLKKNSLASSHPPQPSHETSNEVTKSPQATETTAGIEPVEKGEDSTSKIYALLVGIDIYKSPAVTNLRGCKNDIAAVEQWLEQRSTTGVDVEVLTLADSAATYQGIIDGFQNHLSKADKDDVALFYYSGHGAQAKAAEIFWTVEPDKLNETIVCHDSRQNGVYDLADKELAVLIAGVSQKAGHVLTIFDSCHSGSITREAIDDPSVRLTTVDYRERPWEKYFFAEMSQEDYLAQHSASGWLAPKGNHVVLSACAPEELAKEMWWDGKIRGAFSYNLLKALDSYGATLSYRALHHQVKNYLTIARVRKQTPALEAYLEDGQDAREQPFLGGAVRQQQPYFLVKHSADKGWTMNAGALQGIQASIQAPQDGEHTELAIFALDSSPEQRKNLDNQLAVARATHVHPTYSQLELSKGTTLEDTTASYQAVVVAVPMPRTAVFFKGDEASKAAMREALASASTDNQASIYVREVADEAEAELILSYAAKEYKISAQDKEQQPFAVNIPSQEVGALKKAIARLEHIARWQLTRDLHNPTSALLEAHDAELAKASRQNDNDDDTAELNAAFKVEVFWVKQEEGKEKLISIDPAEKQLDAPYYRDSYGEWQPAEIKVCVTNTSKQDLHMALLDITQSYGIYPTLLGNKTEKVAAGETIWANDGQPITLQIMEEFLVQGVREFEDVLKLLVSTEGFDANLLYQKDLDVTFEPRGLHRSVMNRFEHLLAKIQTRHLGHGNSKRNPDWTTWQLSFITMRSLETIALAAHSKGVPLGSSMHIENHSDLQAQLYLSSRAEPSRSVQQHQPFPALLRNEGELVNLNPEDTRDLATPLRVLELRDVQHAESVTAEHSLELSTTIPLRDDDKEREYILATAYDPDLAMYIPVGVGQPADGGAHISIERLPAATPDSLPDSLGEKGATRSFGNSIKLWFHKFISEKTFLTDNYPRLRTVKVDAEGKVAYGHNVAYDVQNAERILLLVHGILGETRSIAKHLPQLNAAMEQLPDAQAYDLVLAFDYENLNTKLEDTAAMLRQRLVEVGLAPHHGKTLHIAAHSMGGLVSRYLLEHLPDTKAMVQKLVLLGTPSGGSPWPSVVDMLTTYLTLGLNAVVVFPWAATGVVGWFVRALATGSKLLNEETHALEQMQVNSTFLQKLSQSNTVNTRYFSLAGDKPLDEAKAKHILQKVVRKIVAKAEDIVFLEQANDLAVLVSSVQQLPAALQAEAAQQRVVPCNHFNYFSDAESVKALAALLQASDD